MAFAASGLGIGSTDPNSLGGSLTSGCACDVVISNGTVSVCAIVPDAGGPTVGIV